MALGGCTSAMRVLVGALLALLIVPTSALAGGFATVGLSSTPDGTRPGEPWDVEVTILQHGRSDAPLIGVNPAVIVSKDDGSSLRRFDAMPTDRPGVYRASVVFASAGTWRYRVNDGFAGAIHTYPPVEIGDGSASAVVPVSGSHGGPNVWLAVLAAVVAGLGTGLAARLLRPPAGLSRPAEV
jgi:hypothetical protein